MLKRLWKMFGVSFFVIFCIARDFLCKISEKAMDTQPIAIRIADETNNGVSSMLNSAASYIVAET